MADQTTTSCPTPEEEFWYFDEWRALGFTPLEAIKLVREAISPSLIREFCRHHPLCDVRTAVQIHR